MIVLVVTSPASELFLHHHPLIPSRQIISPASAEAMPTFTSRENVSLLRSKKQKLNVQQSCLQILGQEVLATTNGNRVSNDTPPNEPMVESHDCEENDDKCMAERHDAEDNAAGLQKNGRGLNVR
jgi:hypothetical protein